MFNNNDSHDHISLHLIDQFISRTMDNLDNHNFHVFGLWDKTRSPRENPAYMGKQPQDLLAMSDTHLAIVRK